MSMAAVSLSTSLASNFICSYMLVCKRLSKIHHKKKVQLSNARPGQIFYFDDKGKINVKMMLGFQTMFKPNKIKEGFTLEGDMKIKLSTELKSSPDLK